MTILYRAQVETRNFDFEGFGSSALLARRALKAGLERHAEQYGLTDPKWVDETLADAFTIKMVAGKAMRDREEL